MLLMKSVPIQSFSSGKLLLLRKLKKMSLLSHLKNNNLLLQFYFKDNL